MLASQPSAAHRVPHPIPKWSFIARSSVRKDHQEHERAGQQTSSSTAIHPSRFSEPPPNWSNVSRRDAQSSAWTMPPANVEAISSDQSAASPSTPVSTPIAGLPKLSHNDTARRVTNYHVYLHNSHVRPPSLPVSPRHREQVAFPARTRLTETGPADNGCPRRN